jgi:hypothetical protein
MKKQEKIDGLKELIKKLGEEQSFKLLKKFNVSNIEELETLSDDDKEKAWQKLWQSQFYQIKILKEDGERIKKLKKENTTTLYNMVTILIDSWEKNNGK